MTEIKSINELLGMELDIPDYQRPYKWTIQNIEDLLSDISNSITDAEMYRTFKYRIGTIILHKNDNQKDLQRLCRQSALALLIRNFR